VITTTFVFGGLGGVVEHDGLPLEASPPVAGWPVPFELLEGVGLLPIELLPGLGEDLFEVLPVVVVLELEFDVLEGAIAGGTTTLIGW
jgi:hypothetical protein